VSHSAVDGPGKDRPAVSARWPGVSQRAYRRQQTGRNGYDEPQAYECTSGRAQRRRCPPCCNRAPLPAPDDDRTPRTPGAGCPIPPETTNVDYGPSPQEVICPPYDSATSQTNRSGAREVIRRFRELSRDDQQGAIEFLKQL